MDENSQQPESEWDIKDSVFSSYKIDSDDVNLKCFEYDWNQSKIPNVVKDEDEQKAIYEYLRSVYKSFREAYKYYAGISPYENIPSIGLNVYTLLLEDLDVVNGKDTKLSDSDITYIATAKGAKDTSLTQNKQLIRYQFMEALVRIGLHKYFKSQEDTPESESNLTQSQAVMKLFEDHLLEHFNQFDSNKWRFEKLWNEDVDAVLKSHMETLKNLYMNYSGKYALPGKPKFASLEEFLLMIENSGVTVNEEIGTKEISVIFNVSMMTQVDELYSKRHTEMNFVEFLEAICRVADKIKEFSDTDTMKNEESKDAASSASNDKAKESDNLDSKSQSEGGLKSSKKEKKSDIKVFVEKIDKFISLLAASN